MSPVMHIWNHVNASVYAVSDSGDGDQDRYFVILVPLSRIGRFLQTVGTRGFELEEFGRTLFWGQGTPEESVLKECVQRHLAIVG